MLDTRTSRSDLAAVDELEERLQQLVAEARESPPVQRRQRLNEIVRLISMSGKLWREETPDYQDALQQTWLYLCRNLETYDSSRANVITWLDNHLKWRLEDFRQAQQAELARRVSGSMNDEAIDRIDNIPAPPEIPPILEAVRRWVQTDPNGELSSIHVQGRPDVTCQILILRRLPPETRWSEIASEFNLSQSTAANFYRRQCLPRLRKFGEDRGYL